MKAESQLQAHIHSEGHSAETHSASENQTAGRVTNCSIMAPDLASGTLTFQPESDCLALGGVGSRAGGDVQPGDTSWSLLGEQCGGNRIHTIHSSRQAGPVWRTHQNCTKYNKPTLKQTNIFLVIWDPAVKPKGIFGGHLNIRSLLPNCDEIKSLLQDLKPGFLVP